jgi:hypothetical protein
MAELSQPRSCGMHFVPEIGHKIEIFAKKGEDCDHAVARVFAKWKTKGPKGEKKAESEALSSKDSEAKISDTQHEG